MNGAVHLLGVDALAGDDEVEVNACENFRVLRRTVDLDLHDAVTHVLTGLSQNCDNVISGATTHAGQHRFHRPRAEITSSAFRHTVHHDRMAALGLRYEAHVLDPFDSDFQGFPHD